MTKRRNPNPIKSKGRHAATSRVPTIRWKARAPATATPGCKDRSSNFSFKYVPPLCSSHYELNSCSKVDDLETCPATCIRLRSCHPSRTRPQKTEPCAL